MLHFEPGLKDDHFSGRNRNALAGTGIAAEARTTLLDLENTKIPQLNFFRADKAIYNNIKGFLNDFLDVNLFDAGRIGYLKDNIFFGHLSSSLSRPSGLIASIVAT